MPSPPRGRRLLPWLSLLGAVVLSYLLGAAVMFFRLPSADFLSKGFLGARAWNERRQDASAPADRDSPAVVVGTAAQGGKPFEGYTLYACASRSASSTQAFLINMRGEVVHQWAVPFSKVWPNPPHIRERVDDSWVCIFGCHLFANGDLLVVFHGQQDFATGYGLAKLDRDSNVLWRYAANVHHDVDVGADGRIYATEHHTVERMPKGLEYLPTPSLVDSVVVLSPKGEPVKEPVPILEAFRDSPYAAFLSPLQRLGTHYGPAGDDIRRQDVLHANFVQVLTPEKAAKFPLFKEGQVLVSLRHLDTIAAIDLDRRAVTWAARGPWQSQHDPQFLDNGHLLIFDNLGLVRRSRVLEYDPNTQACPWSWSGENGPPFFTSERGMCQRLPNGNTLVVNSESGELLEVTPNKEVVWSCSTNKRYVTTARRYGPDQVSFLKGPDSRP
jgi:hypothetical protein